MGVILEDEREALREILSTAVKYKDDCPVAFNLWNSIFNDNGDGGSPGLFWKFTGSSATMMLPINEGNKSFDNSTNWFKTPEVSAAMHYAGIPSAQFDEGGQV